MSDQIVTLLSDLAEENDVAVGIPKLRLPFAMVTNASGSVEAETVEQDTQAEIAQCAYAICATRLGERADLPEFGIEDPAFRDGGADLNEIRSAIEEFEPRAEPTFEADFDGVVQQIAVALEVRE